MTLEELKKKYEKIPYTLKLLKRWVCFKMVPETQKDGTIKKRKVPMAPIVNYERMAQANNPNSWGYFDQALNAMIAHGYDGIGLEFGLKGCDNPIFGVDLDYHPEKTSEVSMKRFNETLKEFDNALQTYVEYSPSGNGYHFICFGTVPEGRKRNEEKAQQFGSVEIYGSERFFTITGKPYVEGRDVVERTKEIVPLWKKYVDDTEQKMKALEQAAKKRQEWNEQHKSLVPTSLSDEELIQIAKNSYVGARFTALYEGDLDITNGDHSKADMALCNYLAFFTGRNAEQMDRIFRSSGLMREKWEREDYRERTISEAINTCTNVYSAPVKPVEEIKEPEVEPVKEEKQLGDDSDTPIQEMPVNPVMNIDNEGNPIFRVDNFKPNQRYDLTDTGNALRFYDLFGSEFRYNATDKYFMFWTGKTWVADVKGYIREYANEFLRLLADELKQMQKKIDQEVDPDKQKVLKAKKDAYEKNWQRLSNKAGKDAMLNELQTLKKMPVESKEFNKNPYLLNTDSGIVDLTTGKIMDYDKKLMMVNNTKIKVSYEEPKVFLKFLHGIFQRDSQEETEAIVECFRRCIGYTLTGDTSEEVMFLLYGEGANGKSVLSGVLQDILGDYFGTMDSSQLMVNKNQNVSVQNSLAELQHVRYLITQETDEGERLSEPLVKKLTGGKDAIAAQKKYGTPFFFRPKFKVWMMTNHKPHVLGGDYGIWRRLFLFPFLHIFKGEERDIHMAEKLEAEYPQILGWCIKGCVDYLSKEDGGLKKPACLEVETESYRMENDVVARFLEYETISNQDGFESKDDVYTVYKQWCRDNNDYCKREEVFRREMKAKGYPCDKKADGYYYSGFKLVNPPIKASAYDGPSWKFDD